MKRERRTQLFTDNGREVRGQEKKEPDNYPVPLGLLQFRFFSVERENIHRHLFRISLRDARVRCHRNFAPDPATSFDDFPCKVSNVGLCEVVLLGDLGMSGADQLVCLMMAGFAITLIDQRFSLCNQVLRIARLLVFVGLRCFVFTVTLLRLLILLIAATAAGYYCESKEAEDKT